jgi:hypothetical protein
LEISQWVTQHPSLGESPVFWSALIAAGVSLLGVVVANWNSRRQLAMQIAANSKEKEAERQFELRRDVFLDVSNWAQATIDSTSSLADFGKTYTGEWAELDALRASITKAELVSSERTIKLFMSMALMSTNALVRFGPRRRQLGHDLDDIVKRKLHRDTYPTDSPQWAGISDEIDDMYLTLAMARHRFSADVYDEADAQMGVCSKLLVAMRAELGMPIDEVAYLAIAANTLREGRKIIDASRQADLRPYLRDPDAHPDIFKS